MKSGYKLIENHMMTDWYELIKIKRTFWERYFTRPWMPLIKYKFKRGPQVPAMHVYIIEDKLIGHPAILKTILKSMEGGFTEFIELESLRWVLGEDEKEEHNHE